MLSSALRRSAGLVTPCRQVQLRTFVKVGDKIPISYIKDEAVPVIKADEEYPEWVHTLHKRGATLNELVKKFNAGGIEGMSNLERRRVKRLIGLQQVKSYNFDHKKGN